MLHHQDRRDRKEAGSYTRDWRLETATAASAMVHSLRERKEVSWTKIIGCSLRELWSFRISILLKFNKKCCLAAAPPSPETHDKGHRSINTEATTPLKKVQKKADLSGPPASSARRSFRPAGRLPLSTVFSAKPQTWQQETTNDNRHDKRPELKGRSRRLLTQGQRYPGADRPMHVVHVSAGLACMTQLAKLGIYLCRHYV